VSPSPNGNEQPVGATREAGAGGPPARGLSDAEAARRRAAGQGNDVQVHAGRTYKQIVRANVFNFINNLYFGLGVLLIALGRYLDAFVAVGVILANTLVSLFQEIRAKRTIDRIAILTRPRATVVRDGAEREVDPSEIVVGDLLRLHPGDQIVVDGRVRGEGRLEVDESLLTGESDLVLKTDGDALLSGSFCATGGGHYEAERVGLESFANKLTAKATSYRRELTPLQREVYLIIRTLLIVVLAFTVLVWSRSISEHLPFVEGVRMSTVVVALIPNGLVLSIALAYALGAVRMLGKGMLIQQANAVESLSNVDVLCTDKTGTLTSNVISLHETTPLDDTEEDLETLLGDYAATTTDVNRTVEALARAYHGIRRRPSSEALFSSRRKWSGLSFEEGALRGTYVLGAPEVVGAALPDGAGFVAPGEAPGEPEPAAGVEQPVDAAAVPAWQEPSRWDLWPWPRRRRGRAEAGEGDIGEGDTTAAGAAGDAAAATAGDAAATEPVQPALFGDEAFVGTEGGEARGAHWREHAARLAAAGYRVLLFAAAAEPVAFAGEPELPPGLRPLAVVSLRDELRPHVHTTLEEFGRAGIEVKVISGDDPRTVAAIALQAGLQPGDEAAGAGTADERIRVVPDVQTETTDVTGFATLSGTDLDALSGDAFDAAAMRTRIFGRVTPEQKQSLVRALRRRKRHVAMIGDGVNDVVALKEANVSVAMNGGAQAARGVADLVLLNDSFDVLPYAFREGQRILNGMNDILRMFMVRILAKAGVVGVVVAAGGFPFAPRQASMLSFIGAGIPAVAFAVWAKPGPVPKTSLFRRLARFVLPAAVAQWLMTMTVYYIWAAVHESLYLADHPGASEADLLLNALPPVQTATTIFAALCGILVVPLLAPPSEWWVGGAPLRRDWRFAALTVLLFAVLIVSAATAGGRRLFELTPLPLYQYAALGAAAFGWLMLVRWIWRSGLLDRWLGPLDGGGRRRPERRPL
jgi:magnesium-transporting ATPase (P-type)